MTFPRTFKLRNEFLNKCQMLRMLLTQMVFAGSASLIQSIFGSYAHGSIMAQNFEYACLYSQTLSLVSSDAEEDTAVSNISIRVIRLN
jgi:hypothetical protein